MLRGGGGGWRRQASEGAEKDGRAWGRSRGGGGVAGREGSRKGWATPAATRLRFKTESRGDVLLPGSPPYCDTIPETPPTQ